MNNFTHITTPSSLRAGMEDTPPSECIVCGRKEFYADWVGMLCHSCGTDINVTMAKNIMTARKTVNINRNEFSELIGYKQSTIAKYEISGVASDKYINKCIAALRDIYKDQRYVKRQKKLNREKTKIKLDKFIAEAWSELNEN